MRDEMYPAAESPEPESEDSKSEDEGQETALLPRSLFTGKDLKVGSECKIRVESIHDDEVEVSYVPHKDKKEDKSENDMPDDMENPVDKMMNQMT